MNRERYLKLLWTVTGICILLGTVGRAFGWFAFSNRRHSDYYEEPYPDHVETWEETELAGMPGNESFHTVNIRDFVGSVVITEGEDYDYQYSDSGYERDEQSLITGFELTGGVLTVTQSGRENLDSEHSVSLYITVPYGIQLQELHIEMTAGSVILENISAEYCSIGNSAGEAQLSGCRFNTVNIKLDAGNLAVNSSQFSSLSADIALGEANISCGDLEGCSYTLKADVGTVMVRGRQYGNSVRVDRDDAEMRWTMEVNCGVGSIYVDEE